MGNKVVVVFSGGMDSYTVLHKAAREGFEVLPLTFNYGQKHNKEIEYAEHACIALGVVPKIVDITAINQFSNFAQGFTHVKSFNQGRQPL